MNKKNCWCENKNSFCQNLYPTGLCIPKPLGITGPTGPTGATGGEFAVKSTTTIEAGLPARVEAKYEEGRNLLDFYIPKGADGVSEKIKAGCAFAEEYDQPASVIDRYEEDAHYLDFVIPRGMPGVAGEKGEKGEPGEKGDKGEVETSSAFILSYNDDPTTFPVEGKEIPSNTRLPLMRLELDNGGMITLDSQDMTIQFNKTGVYYISFTTNAYTKHSGADFNPETDFVSIAFREVESEKILVGATSLSYNECAITTIGQGMFVVTDLATAYELVNTQQKSIYINGCNVIKTISKSYFAVPMVSVSIIKLK